MIIFIFIFSTQFIFENIFFDRYYNFYKETKLKNSINGFKDVIYNDSLANEHINKTLEEDEVLISYLDKDLNIIKGDLTDSIKLNIKTIHNKIEKLSIEFIPLSETELMVGDFVEIDGLKLEDDDKIYVKKIIIKRKNKLILDLLINNFDSEVKKQTNIKIKGDVTYFKTISQKHLNHKEAIINYLNYFDKKEIKDREGIITNLSGEYLINFKKVDDNYILASTSLEGSEEIIKILNNFKMYIIPLILILVILIIYIYSKQITKPLIRMKEVANSIAKQDFDKKVNINSKDELQDLAESLNEISSNLKSNINQLKEANKKLKKEYEERLDMEKNQNFLLINISHDLKTPLTIIKGYLKAIKDGIYNKDEYIDYTIDGVDEISKTLNEMLEITKLRSKSYSLDINTVDFTRLVYKIYDKLKYLTKEKQQTIRFNLLDEAFVDIDEKEMKKVLENLMTNAIKYSPTKENINIDLTEKHNNYIFTIENEGVHIPEEDMNNIFKEFYRVDKSRNKKNGGNGLGLVIVKVILQAHNISYTIENSEKGIKFTMYLSKFLKEKVKK